MVAFNGSFQLHGVVLEMFYKNYLRFNFTQGIFSEVFNVKGNSTFHPS